MSVILDFKNGVYTINGVGKTLAEVVEENAGWGNFTAGDVVPGVGLTGNTSPVLTAAAETGLLGGFVAVVDAQISLTATGPQLGRVSAVIDVHDYPGYAEGWSSGVSHGVGAQGSQWLFYPNEIITSDYLPTTTISAALSGDGVYRWSMLFSPSVLGHAVDCGAMQQSGNPENNAAATQITINIVATLSGGATGSGIIEKVSFYALADYGIGDLAGLSCTNPPVAPDLDANPAHMIYECLTNRDWGMGAPTTMIDTAAFEAAGVTLYNEGLGLSMLWLRQDTIENFVSEIIDHIQATVFVNPRTGLITIKLIRGDYDPLTLRTITPDNADLTNFQRKAWGEIVNEVVVTWTNPITEQDETVVAQDLGAIAAQNGAIISDNRNYYGVRSAAVATQLAARDLRSAAAPMATCEVTLDRTAWDLLPGEVVKLTWPEYGFDGVVMRVGAVDYGKPGEPLIRANLIEDVFGLALGDYITPPASQWQGVDAPPSAADFSRIITVPAFFATNALAAAGDNSTFDYPEVIAGVLASDADAYNYDLFGPTVRADGSTVQERQSTNTVLGRATTSVTLPLAATTSGVTFSGLTGTISPAQTVFVFIGGDGTAESAMEIALITASAGTVHTLARGLLDTVPREWPSGTVVWLLEADSTISDLDAKSDGETVTYRLLMRTFGGLLDYDLAAPLNGTLSGRPHYPNRPANVTAHGAAWSSAAANIDARARIQPWVTVTWANRNRLMEDSQVLLWTDATVTPEVGQTSRIEVCTLDGTVLTTHAGLSGAAFNVPDASFGGEAVVRLRVWAARTDSFGSFDSLQYFEHWVRVAPLRFDSTRVTFDSTLWTMDQG